MQDAIAGIDTLVIGVKNRAEMRDCLSAEAAGPLPAEVTAHRPRLQAPAPAVTRCAPWTRSMTCRR
ncbi:MAG TPA: hypothetical protein VKX28_00530 [Xanthobacteraceae bacterium]|nr:hypothetical protein [Xanthobacteraceae bacterium]